MSEPTAVIKHRQFLEHRKKVLEDGREVFEGLFSRAND